MRRNTDRHQAVSDLIGFAVVFGIVVLSISLVYTFGLGALTDVQNDEAFDNAERAFDIIADNVGDVNNNGAPSRSTEVDFGQGDLSLTGEANLTVEYGTGNATALVTPLRYRNDVQGLFYVSGAVVRTSRDSATMIREPPFRFGAERTVVSLVQTKQAGDTASLGGGSARVTTRQKNPSQVAVETGGVSYEIIVTSPRFRAWQRYLEDEGLSCTGDVTANQVTCSGTTETLYVRNTRINVRLIP